MVEVYISLVGGVLKCPFSVHMWMDTYVVLVVHGVHIGMWHVTGQQLTSLLDVEGAAMYVQTLQVVVRMQRPWPLYCLLAVPTAGRHMQSYAIVLPLESHSTSTPTACASSAFTTHHRTRLRAPRPCTHLCPTACKRSSHTSSTPPTAARPQSRLPRMLSQTVVQEALPC